MNTLFHIKFPSDAFKYNHSTVKDDTIKYKTQLVHDYY